MIQYILLASIVFFLPSYVRRYPFLLLAGGVFYSAITKQVSVSYLDYNSIYISESGVISEYIGAGYRHLLYNSILFISMLIPWYLVGRNSRNISYSFNYQNYLFFFIICIIILSLQTYNVFASGFAFAPSRHDIWLNVPITLFRNIFGILIIFIPFYAGFLFAKGIIDKRKNISRLGLILILYYFAYILITSQGFNGLLVISVYFLSPILILFYRDKNRLNFSINYKIIILSAFIILFFLLIGSQGISNRGISQYSSGGYLSTLFYRIFVLQGGFYYASDLQTIDSDGNSILNLTSLIEGSKSLLNENLVDIYQDRSVNVAGSIIGVLINTMGFYFAVPMIILYGFILGLICIFAYQSVIRGKITEIIIISYLLLWTSSVYQTGSIASILSIKFIFFSLIYLILRLNQPNSRFITSIG